MCIFTTFIRHENTKIAFVRHLIYCSYVYGVGDTNVPDSETGTEHQRQHQQRFDRILQVNIGRKCSITGCAR